MPPKKTTPTRSIPTKSIPTRTTSNSNSVIRNQYIENLNQRVKEQQRAEKQMQNLNLKHRQNVTNGTNGTIGTRFGNSNYRSQIISNVNTQSKLLKGYERALSKHMKSRAEHNFSSLGPRSYGNNGGNSSTPFTANSYASFINPDLHIDDHKFDHLGNLDYADPDDPDDPDDPADTDDPDDPDDPDDYVNDNDYIDNDNPIDYADYIDNDDNINPINNLNNVEPVDQLNRFAQTVFANEPNGFANEPYDSFANDFTNDDIKQALCSELEMLKESNIKLKAEIENLEIIFEIRIDNYKENNSNTSTSTNTKSFEYLQKQIELLIEKNIQLTNQLANIKIIFNIS